MKANHNKRESRRNSRIVVAYPSKNTPRSSNVVKLKANHNPIMAKRFKVGVVAYPSKNTPRSSNVVKLKANHNKGAIKASN